VMIDDHSRLAYAELLDRLTAACAAGFLRRAVAWFAERGVPVRRYNYRRPHGSLGHQPPGSRLNNLIRNYS
jgi:transposase InsO family protein